MLLQRVTHEQILEETEWNKACGPTALSAITGQTAEQIALAIQGMRGNDEPVETTDNLELTRALRSMRYEVSISFQPP